MHDTIFKVNLQPYIEHKFQFNMLEPNLFSKLLPSHPDFLPILKRIRDKYDIPEVDPDEDGIEELLINNKEFEWPAIRKDIEIQIRNNSDLFPPEQRDLLRLINLPEGSQVNFTELNGLPKAIKKRINNLLLGIFTQFLNPLKFATDAIYTGLSDSLLEFLMTGKTREIPNDWFGIVKTSSIFGEKVVFAMASQLSDPKAISDQFRHEYTRTFGKDRPNITEGNLKTAEYLRMRLSHTKFKDILDIYIQRNPSMFPKDTHSKEYQEARGKLEENMKKKLRRLQDAIDKILGDKN